MKINIINVGLRFIFLLCFLSTAAGAPVSQVAWVKAASNEFSEVLQMPVNFLQSGPQHVFYVQNLFADNKEEVIAVLDRYRLEVPTDGAIVLVGIASEIAYWATPRNGAQVLTNTTMADFYASLVDGRYPAREPQEAAVEPQETARNQIVGSNRAEVNQLLNNWEREPSEANTSNMNYYDPDETVKLTVSFGPDNRAVGASVVNLYGIPISEARLNQLLDVIGGPSPEIVRHGGDIVEFYVGDAYLY